MSDTEPLLRVAVPGPLRRAFDYLPPKGLQVENLPAGIRVLVPFGRQQLVGVLLGVVKTTDISPDKLKRVKKLIDQQPVLPAALVKLLQWASRYYQHPIGDVFSTALPALLRTDRPARARGKKCWCLTEAGRELDPASLKRAPRQQAILQQIQQHTKLDADALSAVSSNWRPAMRHLIEQGWVELTEETVLPPVQSDIRSPHTLNPAQQQAVEVIAQSFNHFQALLLDGVTGSGKTAVYLEVIKQVIEQGQQVLVLVPEIGLTPQLVSRFRNQLATPVVVMHSGLTDQERLSAWLLASSGEAKVVIGTRSAVFTPLQRVGLFIIDEEHDLSFKQQDGFRYSARDLAILRARDAGVPIVLGTATPSLETLYNCRQGRYQHLSLPMRAGAARPPQIRLIDVRKQPMDHLISVGLREGMRRHLEQAGQVLLFLNRRGFAPMLICHDCGWISQCSRCDSRMTLHQQINRLRCHHCDKELPVPEACPACQGTDLRSFGYGTERIEQALQKQFPDHTVLRIDRDTTRRKGAMQSLLDKVHSGEGQILLGTQMLAKGHHFPNVTLVGILDADYGLYSVDMRASERMAQLIMQVAGRAGRAERAGEVLIQTHHPEHPLLQTLIKQGYGQCAELLLKERADTNWPPYSYLAMLRADSTNKEAPMAFLAQAAELAAPLIGQHCQVLGPIASAMERRAGRFRAQLLVQASQRQALQQFLGSWLVQLETIKKGRNVRWSIDVDPMELF